MTDYFYDMDLVVDPLNPANVVANGQVSIFDPADTAGTTLLALKDPSGLPLPNPLPSNANGFLPPRIAQLPQVMWKSGGFTGYFNSYKGLRDESVAAKTAAQTAANSATSAANEVVTTATVDGTGALVLTKASGATVNAGNVKGAKGDKGDKGDKGADGSNVLPTDTAIKQAIEDTASATRGALSATYVPKWKANTAYLAGDAVLSPSGDTVTAKANFTSGATYNAANWNASATFAPRRANGRYDPAGKPTGTVTALDTGQAVLNFGGAPASVVAGGYITHTPIAGASASYMQVSLDNPIQSIGCEVQWQPGATIEQVAFVLPLTPWGGVPMVGPVAGVHFVISGNGQWHCSYWTGSGEESPYYGSGRCGDVRDGQWHKMSIEITDLAAGKAVINLPDGSFAPVQSPRITQAVANNAIWELFETNGTGITTPARLRKLWVHDAPQYIDALTGTPGQAVQAVSASKRVITEFTASGGGNIPSGAVGAFVTLIAPGGGGGSGRRGAAGTIRGGGGSGGAGGVINEQFIPISALGTSYTVTLGAGGTGGASVTTNDTNGTAGGAGGTCQFASGTLALRTLAGGGGGGGTAGAGAAGNGGAPLSISGVASSATGAAGTNGALVTTGAPGQAGAGGGITSADVASNGGAGSSSYLWGNNSGGAGGVVDGAAPASPALAPSRQGDAPGGGAASITTAAQAGANGLGYGVGGGGGGASLNGNNSGKGGDGGPGYARVTFVIL